MRFPIQTDSPLTTADVRSENAWMSVRISPDQSFRIKLPDAGKLYVVNDIPAGFAPVADGILICYEPNNPSTYAAITGVNWIPPIPTGYFFLIPTTNKIRLRQTLVRSWLQSTGRSSIPVEGRDEPLSLEPAALNDSVNTIISFWEEDNYTPIVLPQDESGTTIFERVVSDPDLTFDNIYVVIYHIENRGSRNPVEQPVFLFDTKEFLFRLLAAGFFTNIPPGLNNLQDDHDYSIARPFNINFKINGVGSSRNVAILGGVQNVILVSPLIDHREISIPPGIFTIYNDQLDNDNYDQSDREQGIMIDAQLQAPGNIRWMLTTEINTVDLNQGELSHNCKVYWHHLNPANDRLGTNTQFSLQVDETIFTFRTLQDEMIISIAGAFEEVLRLTYLLLNKLEFQVPNSPGVRNKDLILLHDTIQKIPFLEGYRSPWPYLQSLLREYASLRDSITGRSRSIENLLLNNGVYTRRLYIIYTKQRIELIRAAFELLPNFNWGERMLQNYAAQFFDEDQGSSSLSAGALSQCLRTFRRASGISEKVLEVFEKYLDKRIPAIVASIIRTRLHNTTMDIQAESFRRLAALAVHESIELAQTSEAGETAIHITTTIRNGVTLRKRANNIMLTLNLIVDIGIIADNYRRGEGNNGLTIIRAFTDISRNLIRFHEYEMVSFEWLNDRFPRSMTATMPYRERFRTASGATKLLGILGAGISIVQSAYALDDEIEHERYFQAFFTTVGIIGSTLEIIGYGLEITVLLAPLGAMFISAGFFLGMVGFLGIIITSGILEQPIPERALFVRQVRAFIATTMIGVRNPERTGWGGRTIHVQVSEALTFTFPMIAQNITRSGAGAQNRVVLELIFFNYDTIPYLAISFFDFEVKLPGGFAFAIDSVTNRFQSGSTEVTYHNLGRLNHLRHTSEHQYFIVFEISYNGTGQYTDIQFVSSLQNFAMSPPSTDYFEDRFSLTTRKKVSLL